MDFRERFNDPLESLRTVLDGRQVQIWTALPGIIESVDMSKLTVTVQPAIQAVVVDSQGNRSNHNMPILPDVPIIYPRGGDYTLTFPIKQGDECLVVFSARCIDNWWQNGGVQPQFEQRLHDLSDGFALVGPFSQAQVIKSVSATTTQLRTNDGEYFVEIDDENDIVRLVTPQTSVTLDDKNFIVTGKAGAASVAVDGKNNKVTATAGSATATVDGSADSVVLSAGGATATVNSSGVTISGARINLN